MQVCLFIDGAEGVDWGQWVAVAQAAERAGLDGLFRSDHYRSIFRGEPAGSLDAWGTLTALATQTSRIRLGTLVSPVTFRSASVLAKAVVTLDHVSNGRAELGIGAGWFEPEHRTYGFPFGTLHARLKEVERQLTEIDRQWTTAEDVWPKPVQKPHPPIVLGGAAKPHTVQIAVAHADEYNTTGTIDEVRRRRVVLDDASRAADKPPLRLSVMLTTVVGDGEADLQTRLETWQALEHGQDKPQIAGTIDQVAEGLRSYAAVGVDRVMLLHYVHEDVDMVHLLGEVAHRLRP